MRKLLPFLFMVLPAAAFGQGAVTQNGAVSQFDVARFAHDHIAESAGGLTGKNGRGVNPFAVVDSNGLALCDYSTAPISSAASTFCMGHDSNGNAILTVDGNPSPSFSIRLNGTLYPFPGAGNGNTTMSVSPNVASGNQLLANGGTALRDAGLPSMTSLLGADPTGAVDATAIIQSCLTNVGAGGTCYTGGGRYKVLGNLTIPANTTLKCGFVFGDTQDNPIAAFGTMPALMLDGAHTISATGQGAGVKDCLIVRNGMTFPAADSNLFAGLALTDGGLANFSVENTVIVGFDSAIWWRGPRPYGHKIFADGTGLTHAVIQVDTGNTDSGLLDYIKLQPMATGNGSCTGSLRAGTGLASGGIGGIGFYLDHAVVQNFITDFDFETPVAGGAIAADGLDWFCGFGRNDLGIKVGLSSFARFADVTVSGVKKGILSLSNGNSQNAFGYLFAGTLGGNGVELGDGVHSGNLKVANFVSDNVSGYAVYRNHVDSTFAAGTAQLSLIHNGNGAGAIGLAPYFFNNASAFSGQLSPRVFWIPSLKTDLGAGSVPYGGFTVASGGADMMGGISLMLGTCTGMGASGVCSLSANSDAVNGEIILSPAGAAPGQAGTVPLTLPVAATNVPNCELTLVNAGNAWPVSGGVVANVTAFDTDASHPNFQWWSPIALTAGQSYGIRYHCSPW